MSRLCLTQERVDGLFDLPRLGWREPLRVLVAFPPGDLALGVAVYFCFELFHEFLARDFLLQITGEVAVLESELFHALPREPVRMEALRFFDHAAFETRKESRSCLFLQLFQGKREDDDERVIAFPCFYFRHGAERCCHLDGARSEERRVGKECRL